MWEIAAILCFTFFYLITTLFYIKTANLEVDPAENGTINCDNGNIYCAQDSDCNTICNSLMYTCEKSLGQCVPRSITESIPGNVDCRKDRGFFWVLTSNNRWECISGKPNLYGNDGNLLNHVCHGGIFKDDVCRCNGNSLVYRYGDVSTPRCTDSIHLFSSFFPK